MRDYEALVATRTGGGVTRYHTQRTIRSQSVAEHSFGVANLVVYLTNGRASAEMLQEALWHDVAEGATGDTPAPAKWASPGLKVLLDGLEEDHRDEHGLNNPGLSELERKVLKFADMGELVLWSIEEYRMGNTYARVPLENGLNYLTELIKHDDVATGCPRAIEFLTRLKLEYAND